LGWFKDLLHTKFHFIFLVEPFFIYLKASYESQTNSKLYQKCLKSFIRELTQIMWNESPRKRWMGLSVVFKRHFLRGWWNRIRHNLRKIPYKTKCFLANIKVMIFERIESKQREKLYKTCSLKPKITWYHILNVPSLNTQIYIETSQLWNEKLSQNNILKIFHPISSFYRNKNSRKNNRKASGNKSCKPELTHS
jgi:hypothetical protein